MHLWPSTRLRDSFKAGYLNKLEWNLGKMKSQQQQQQSPSQNKLLLDDKGEDSTAASGGPLDHVFCTDLLLIFSCCFCCGACSNLEEI